MLLPRWEFPHPIPDPYACMPYLVLVAVPTGRHVVHLGRGRRVVGTIWNVGAGDPSLRPIQNANSGNLLKVD